jgi:transposase
MDKAYEDDETRAVVRKKGLKPVVPPKKNRLKPWRHSRKTYRKRNMVERAFRRLDAFRRIYTRYDKTDVIYKAYICFAFVIINLN